MQGIKKLHERAALYARRAGLGDYAEDFAQDACLRAVKSGTCAINLRYVLADYYRGMSGRRRKNAEKGYYGVELEVSMDAPLSEEKKYCLHDRIAYEEDTPWSWKKDKRTCKLTTGQLLLLRAIEAGVKEKEIAKRLGVSASRVSLLIREIKEKLNEF